MVTTNTGNGGTVTASNGRITVVGWFIFLGGLYLVSKSRSGYNIIYYSLLLILVLLVVGNYKAISGAMIAQN